MKRTDTPGLLEIQQRVMETGLGLREGLDKDLGPGKLQYVTSCFHGLSIR